MRFVLSLILIAILSAASVEARADEAEEFPTLELLEFLADWETENGDWLDPADLEKMDLPEREQKNETK